MACDPPREKSSAIETYDVNLDSPARAGVAAPVSYEKRPNRSATNAIGLRQKDSNINESDRYPAAHNGLVAGWNSAGKIARSWASCSLVVTDDLSLRNHRKGANRFTRYVF